MLSQKVILEGLQIFILEAFFNGFTGGRASPWEGIPLRRSFTAAQVI